MFCIICRSFLTEWFAIQNVNITDVMHVITIHTITYYYVNKINNIANIDYGTNEQSLCILGYSHCYFGLAVGI